MSDEVIDVLKEIIAEVLGDDCSSWTQDIVDELKARGFEIIRVPTKD